MLQVEFDDMAQVMSVFGPYDEYVKAIEKALGVAVKSRDNVVEVSGEADEDVRIAAETLRTLKKMLAKGDQMSEWMVGQAMDMVRSGNADDAIEAMSDVVAVTYRGKPVKCRTIGQKRYIKAITVSYTHLQRPGGGRGLFTANRKVRGAAGRLYQGDAGGSPGPSRAGGRAPRGGGAAASLSRGAHGPEAVSYTHLRLEA